mgnify:CR=1 FL=1|jgi:hypothetical protein|tara:strand:- start:916 stop:1044 length:129 start_codon:yes stop_codon:yes gene_type:complete
MKKIALRVSKLIYLLKKKIENENKKNAVKSIFDLFFMIENTN